MACELAINSARHFSCPYKALKQAFAEFRDYEKDLWQWSAAWGYDYTSIWKLARLRLEHALETHHFDERFERQGRIQRR
jgi:hypothetical protein